MSCHGVGSATSSNAASLGSDNKATKAEKAVDAPAFAAQLAEQLKKQAQESLRNDKTSEIKRNDTLVRTLAGR